MNPRVHLTMHEVVGTQLCDDSPPEAWDRAIDAEKWREDERKWARRQAREARRRNRRPR